jgi:cytochrome c peroxidase
MRAERFSYGAVFALWSLLVATPCSAADFDWSFLGGLPKPAIPAGNPVTVEKVDLGRHLFYDTRLSVNRQQSCASCHRQELAFTDGLARAKGTTGELHPRSSMSLINVAYAPRLTWAHPDLGLLEEQVEAPMFGENPVELGLKGRLGAVLQEFRRDRVYQRLFRAAFPERPDPFTLASVTQALATFQRTIISTRSPYDRYRRGERGAIPESAKRGEVIFFSGEKAGCFQCHGGWNFSGALRWEGQPNPEVEFHNTGLYNVDGEGAYPWPNFGLFTYTRRREDMGRFRAPTLRNVAVTAPYMHDGSIETLEGVIEHYAQGGRSANPHQSSTIRPLSLRADEKADLIEFLRSLTDREALEDPRWSNPWPKPARAGKGQRVNPSGA